MLDKYRPCFLRGTQTPEHRHTPPQNCGVLVNWHLPMNLIGRTSHELESIFWQRKKAFQVGTSNQNAATMHLVSVAASCSRITPVGAAHLSGSPRWRQGNFSRTGRRPVSWVADSPAIEPFRGSLPKVCRPHLTIDACYLNSANTQRTLKTHSVHPFQLLEYQIW